LVDRTLILRKIADLDTYLGQVREFSGIALDDYRAAWKTQRIVERTLQMMIETCVDIASHIVSDRGMRTPASYADTFKVLSENAVIDLGLHADLDRMAKFRNVVVHPYEAVDAEIVLAILRKHLGDFERYRDAILACLKESKERG
jgi:uncharacterized protein YutE (UPF0331/DUF86 family)